MIRLNSYVRRWWTRSWRYSPPDLRWGTWKYTCDSWSQAHSANQCDTHIDGWSIRLSFLIETPYLVEQWSGWWMSPSTCVRTIRKKDWSHAVDLGLVRVWFEFSRAHVALCIRVRSSGDTSDNGIVLSSSTATDQRKRKKRASSSIICGSGLAILSAILFLVHLPSPNQIQR